MTGVTGARESNAGDDFHFIWSAKKAIQLLEPCTNLKAVCVEGPSVEDSIIFENDEKVLFSIDVAEYYGGEKYVDAEKVIFSQLKYSTRHGDLPWTLSALSAATNAKKDNSIIQRLAQTYKGFLEKYPKNIEKLEIKLVSNRDIEDKFEKLINSCKEELTKSICEKYVDLKNRLGNENHEYLKKIYKETKLSSTEFIGFLKCIDFSECGSDIRDIQEAEVISSLSKLGIMDLKENYDKLIQFIRKQMSPEENEANPINKNIMASFFNTVPDLLFPANSRIIKPQKYIKRNISKEIIDEIVNNKKKYICLYATGGIGKTTVVSDLECDLPFGSVVLMYDCFGGGSYLDPATPLHEYKNSIVQLSNELALKCYTPFLIKTNSDENEYLKNFSNRLKQAANYIKGINDEAVILIVLDAVDNSYLAANYAKDNCFVDKLMKITLPDNVAILVTSRKERLKEFELPYGTAMIELSGFNEEEQRNYLNLFYENISDKQCEEVRKLTNGNPRVQYYVFSRVSESIDEALDYLNPNGKNLSGIFKDALKRIDVRIPSEILSFEELCRGLVELPRPIPIEIITKSTDYNIEKLESVCSEYLIGIHFQKGFITFRDEDFEDYLRKTTKNGESAILKIVNTLYNNRFDDYYSIKYLHIFLEKTKKIDELLEAIYTIDNIDKNLVEDEKNEIILKRIQSAFSISQIYTEKHRLDVYKLLYLLTKCRTAEGGVKEIIIQNLGLAKKLGFESTIKRYISERVNFSQLNELTLQTYANLQINNVKLAEQFFDLSREAIKEYFKEKRNSKNNRNYKNRIERKDISRLGMYIVSKYGAEKLVDWMSHWSPYPVNEYFEITYNLLLQGDIEKALAIIQLSDNIDMFSACAIAFDQLNSPINDEILCLCESLVQNIVEDNKISGADLKYRIELAEILLKRGKCQESKYIVDNTPIKMKFSHISFYEMNGELPTEYAFRFYAIKKFLEGKEYDFNDFWIPSMENYNNCSEREKTEKKEELQRIINYIINSFFVRVRALNDFRIKKIDMDEYCKEASHCSEGRYKFYNDHYYYDYYRVIMKNIFIIVLSQEKYIVEECCKKYLKNKYLDNKFHFYIIHEIIKSKRYIDIAAWYLNELEKKMNQYPQSSYDLKEFYLECSKKAIIFDNKLADRYFNKAIQAITGIDEEAYRRIELFRQFSENYIEDEDSSKLVYNFTRIMEDSYKRLDDNKHLPTKDFFELITNIDPASAIAAACRLEDRDEGYVTLGFEISIPYIINKLLDNNKISKEIAISLSNIDVNNGYAYNYIVDKILEKLKGEQREVIEKVFEVITYDIEKISGGFDNKNIVESISNWGKNNYSESIECVKRLNEAYEFVSNNFKYSDFNTYDNKENLWIQLDKSKIQYNKEYLIDILDSLYYKDRTSLVKYVLDNVTFDKQVYITELLIDVMYSSSINWKCDDCLEVLIEYLNKWTQYNISVEEWRKNEEKLDYVLGLYSKKRYYIKDKNLLLISKIFLIDTNIILEKVMKKAINYLKCDPWEIFSYMESMALIEKHENCSEFLKWCCKKEIDNVHVKSSDKEYKEHEKKDFTVYESIAYYLMKMLGHIEKEKRWYAVHSIYNLYKLNQKKIIDYIVEYVFEDIPELYKDEQYFYFKDYAIIYLLIALRKIAGENISFLNKYILNLQDIALNDKTINILQRELAREILVIAHPLSKEIEDACTVRCENKVIKNRKYRHNGRDRKTSFHFDVMDIVPKVYLFLGDIFGKSEFDVMEDCDKLICSWGVTNERAQKWYDTYITYEYNGRTYGLNTSVECLSKYIQYNAMYYIADEYRKTLPVLDDEYPIYTFDKWISSWLTRTQGRWISDAKTFPPRISAFLDRKRYIENGRYIINDNVFDNLFLYNYKNINYLISYCDASIENEKSRKCYEICMGIMDKKYLNEFMKESQKDNYWIEENFISDEDDDYGFIESITSIADNLENKIEIFDPYTNQMNYSYLIPNGNIQEFFKLVDVAPIDYSITQHKNYPIKTQYWSYSNDDRIYNIVSEGEMLFIEKDALIEYLNTKLNSLVIIQVNIRYSDAYDKYDKKAEETEKRKIYVFNTNLEDILGKVDVKIRNYY